MGAAKLLVLLALLVGCGSPPTHKVRFFAAVSTKEALEEISKQFQNETGIPVELNLGPSSDLARQIEHGAGAALFLSADEAWANYLDDKGLVAKRRDLLTNRLVGVAASDSSLRLHTLADLTQPSVHRLAVAGPAVPAGRYAREALRHADIWQGVEEKLLDGGDVRATLAYVVRGEAEAGLVYATDVRGNPSVSVAFEVPPEYHTPIRYPLVLVAHAPEPDVAARLLDYLSTPSALNVFRKVGFGIVGE